MAQVVKRDPSEYIPGVCNIGPSERARRRVGGFFGLIATIFLLVFLVKMDYPEMLRLFLVFPATGTASAFLQDAFHFCAAFGMRGMYNVLNSAGITDNVELEEHRKKDRNKAIVIMLLSLAIGTLFAVLTLFI